MAEKHLYGIIYYLPAEEGREKEWVSSVTVSESYLDAERAAEADQKKHWPKHRLHSVTHLAPLSAEAGEVFMVSAT